MDIENRQELLERERPKALGLVRSHLRSVEAAHQIVGQIYQEAASANVPAPSERILLTWFWTEIRDRTEEALRHTAYQFRVLDEGTILQLDQQLVGQKPVAKVDDDFIVSLSAAIDSQPDSPRSILYLIYAQRLNATAIAKCIDCNEIDVYSLWQQSMSFLGDSLEWCQSLDALEDESFWIRALQYMDGAASERFAADLNSEIHNQSQSSPYNLLRLIDGLLMVYGSTNPNWRVDDAVRSCSNGVDEESQSLQDILDSSSPTDTVEPEAVLRVETQKSKPAEIKVSEPVLATSNLEPGTRHGVHFDQARVRLPKVTIKMEWLKRLGLLFAVLLGALCLAWIGKHHSGAGPSAKARASFELTRAAGAIGPDGKSFEISNSSHYSRHFALKAGVISLFSPVNKTEVLIEGPAEWEICGPRHITLHKGRLVVRIPNQTKPFVIETDHYRMRSEGGEFGALVDEQGSDLLAFTGQCQLVDTNRALSSGQALRFLTSSEGFIQFDARDQYHQYPDRVPISEPVRVDDNLVVNPSFEIGALSRVGYPNYFYRDLPLSWHSSWQDTVIRIDPTAIKGGVVRVISSSNELPLPVEGERFLWVRQGQISQFVDLQANKNYVIEVRVACPKETTASFQFGVQTDGKWVVDQIASVKGNSTGAPFTTKKLEFQWPDSDSNKSSRLVLSADKMVFFDQVSLRKLR